MTWPWWSLEFLTAAILVTLILVVGPLIRRFGGIFASSVFIAHPSTARHFLRVLDVVYYLVFSAYVTIETQVVPRDGWLGPEGTSVHFDWLFERVGGMLLMGMLPAMRCWCWSDTLIETAIRCLRPGHVSEAPSQRGPRALVAPGAGCHRCGSPIAAGRMAFGQPRRPRLRRDVRVGTCLACEACRGCLATSEGAA